MGIDRAELGGSGSDRGGKERKMVIDINEKGVRILKEIYGDTVLETAEGNQLAIAMRDDTIEMSVVGSGKWFRADMKTGEIEKM